ncbi:MAG: phasin family protein [Beijerinckiaceae bacterium]
MVGQSARAKPAGPRIDGLVNDLALEGLTPAIDTIQAFVREIAQMSEQAFVRTTGHIEELRKARRMEEAAAIQADFLKDAMEHAVQHTRKYILLLATFPRELVRPVNAAVEAAEVARNATAAKAGRLSEIAHKTGQNPHALT